MPHGKRLEPPGRPDPEVGFGSQDVAFGGAGRVEHFAPAVHAGADAVLAASVFHFGDLTIGQVKESMRAERIVVR